MQFAPGQAVVHPHHGPATIKTIASRTIRNSRRRYLKLEVHHSDLTVAVPVDQAEDIGLREILDVEGLRDVFTILGEPSGEVDRTWSRRYKDYTTRLSSGNIRTIAGLIRDLTRRNSEKRLSYGEAKVLDEARTPVIAEFALAMSLSPEEAETAMEAAVVDGVMPLLGKEALAAAG